MDKKVAEYFDKQKPEQKEICLALREILLGVYPEIKEEMRWGAAVYDGGRYYLGVVKYGVNFGFAVGGLSKEEVGRFEGSGKTMRHIKINSPEEIKKEELIELIKLVKTKVKCQPC